MKALQLVMKALASFTDSLVRLDFSIGLDTHLNLWLKRVRHLVSCEAHASISQKLVADDVAKRVILQAHVNGRCVLPASVIHALDHVSRL